MYSLAYKHLYALYINILKWNFQRIFLPKLCYLRHQGFQTQNTFVKKQGRGEEHKHQKNLTTMNFYTYPVLKLNLRQYQTHCSFDYTESESSGKARKLKMEDKLYNIRGVCTRNSVQISYPNDQLTSHVTITAEHISPFTFSMKSYLKLTLQEFIQVT